MEGNYAYYNSYLTGANRTVELKMLTLANTEPPRYPVAAYDLAGNLIGNAASKGAYLALWNSNVANAVTGILAGGTGPFSFILTMKAGQSIPAKVTGEPLPVFSGIFSNQFGSEFN
jgi:hypothetical protein